MVDQCSRSKESSRNPDLLTEHNPSRGCLLSRHFASPTDLCQRSGPLMVGRHEQDLVAPSQLGLNLVSLTFFLFPLSNAVYSYQYDFRFLGTNIYLPGNIKHLSPKSTSDVNQVLPIANLLDQPPQYVHTGRHLAPHSVMKGMRNLKMFCP